MKKILAILALSFIVSMMPSAAFAQNSSIKFEETTWKEIVAKAKKENKLIFLDAFASWCGPCKYLASQIFTKDSVADFYNSNFINAHFDMEKGEGIDIKAKFGVKVYPTLIFINSGEEIVHQGVGSMPSKDFISLGEDALNPEKQLISYKKKYDAGNKDPKFVIEYLSKLKESYSNFDKIASAYLIGLDEKELIKKDNWQIINDYQNDVNSRELKWIIKNKSEFSKIYTESAVDSKLKSAFASEFDKVIKPRNISKTAFDSLKKNVQALGYDKINEVLLAADFAYYKKTKDMDNFVPAAAKFLQLKEADAAHMNDAAWTVYENTADKYKLTTAAEWAKKGMQLQLESGICDTYANILFKLGNKTEAIKYEEQALELAKKEGHGTEEFQKVLEEMKK